MLCSSTQLFYPLQTAFRNLFFFVVFPFLLDRNPPLIQAQDQGEPRSSLTRGHTQPGSPAYLLQLRGERPVPLPPPLNGCCRGELGFRPLPAAHLGQPQEETGPFSSRQTTSITHANALRNGGVPLGTSSLPPEGCSEHPLCTPRCSPLTRQSRRPRTPPGGGTCISWAAPRRFC